MVIASIEAYLDNWCDDIMLHYINQHIIKLLTCNILFYEII